MQRLIFSALATLALLVSGAPKVTFAAPQTIICRIVSQTGAILATCPAPATPAPTTPPAGCSSSNYVNQVNGTAFTTSFCPYSDGAEPYNKLLPAVPQSIDTTYTPALTAYLNYTYKDFYDTGSGGYGAVYFAAATDPLITFNATNFPPGAGPYTASIRIPAKARQSSGSDAQIAVVQPNGDEYDGWACGHASSDWTTGVTLSCSTGGKTSITGEGVLPGFTGQGFSATSGTGLAAGVIRFNELNAGLIPHAIIINVGCIASGYRYPATSNAFVCADGGGIPTGSLLWLNLTDAQINALPSSTAPSYLLPILHALHQYGGYVSDTGQVGPNGEGGAISFVFEPGAPYYAYGTTDPGVAFGNTNGYSTTTIGTSVVRQDPSGINWAALSGSIKVLSGCYALNNCVNP